jgi:hypothetical protein
MAGNTRIPRAELTGVRGGGGSCLALGSSEAHHDGLDEAEAREVPRWRAPDGSAPLERDVAIELPAIVGAANLATRTNVAPRVASQGFSAACALTPLALPAAA